MLKRLTKRKPSDNADAPADIEAVEQESRGLLRDKLSEWSSYAFAGGMASLTAAGAYALATGMQDTALSTLTVALGANWFTSLIWELRQKAASQRDGRAVIAEVSEQIKSNLTDARLAEIVERFNLWLTPF